jgi:hypothetical protein
MAHLAARSASIMRSASSSAAPIPLTHEPEPSVLRCRTGCYATRKARDALRPASWPDDTSLCRTALKSTGLCPRRRGSSRVRTCDCSGDRPLLFRLSRLVSFISSMNFLVLLGLFSRPALAAFVRFDNCLPESYKFNDPTPLQWVARAVDASFDTTDPRHTLRVTMWGNVTGSFTNVALPPANSSDWTNPEKTDGKIQDEPDPGAQDPKLTTLHSRIEVLTYEPWSDNTNFCKSSLANGSCPLAPVFNVNER